MVSPKKLQLARDLKTEREQAKLEEQHAKKEKKVQRVVAQELKKQKATQRKVDQIARQAQKELEKQQKKEEQEANKQLQGELRQALQPQRKGRKRLAATQLDTSISASPTEVKEALIAGRRLVRKKKLPKALEGFELQIL